MIRALLVLGALILSPAAAIGQDTRPKVNVDRNAAALCPIDDCYLTLVDEMLCVVLDEVLDDRMGSFSNVLNCHEGKGNSYICLNVLAQKRYSVERQTDYSDPYILELMTSFQVQLDRCLGEWKKGFVLIPNRQSVTYEIASAKVILGLLEHPVGPIKYDRLTLEIRPAQ